MQKFLPYSLSFLLLWLLLWKCSSPDNYKAERIPIHHSLHAKVISVPETKHKTTPTNGKYQVVTYTTTLSEWSFLNLAWEENNVSHPEIDLIFYYSGNDTIALKEWMTSHKFVYPILFDFDGEFKKRNIKDKKLTSISFVVKDGSIIDFSNPSRPDYDKILKDLLSD